MSTTGLTTLLRFHHLVIGWATSPYGRTGNAVGTKKRQKSSRSNLKFKQPQMSFRPLRPRPLCDHLFVEFHL